MVRLKVVGRNTNSPLYFDIARDSYERYSSLLTERYQPLELGANGKDVEMSPTTYRKIMKWIQTAHTSMARKALFEAASAQKPGLKNMLDLSISMDRCWTETVVFAAFCLEAFIYDYAATHLGDGYTHDFIERLELKPKWVLVPKLVTGKDFPRETQAFQHLGDLVAERNSLVHPKSKSLASISQFIQELYKAVESGEYLSTEQPELNPYQTIIEVLTELKNLEGDAIKSDWWELEEVE